MILVAANRPGLHGRGCDLCKAFRSLPKVSIVVLILAVVLSEQTVSCLVCCKDEGGSQSLFYVMFVREENDCTQQAKGLDE